MDNAFKVVSGVTNSLTARLPSLFAYFSQKKKYQGAVRDMLSDRFRKNYNSIMMCKHFRCRLSLDSIKSRLESASRIVEPEGLVYNTMTFVVRCKCYLLAVDFHDF